MGRSRVYATAAERQKAYRCRGTAPPDQGSKPLPRRTRPPSRPARLATAVATLQALQEEYQAWLDSMPESLADSDLAGKLQETIDQLEGAVDQLSDLDLPRGFGRD
jgi:hypothetical protein